MEKVRKLSQAQVKRVLKFICINWMRFTLNFFNSPEMELNDCHECDHFLSVSLHQRRKIMSNYEKLVPRVHVDI